MVPQFIGFGLTVGWMWMFFLGGPVFAALLKPWPGIGETHLQFFLICTALNYLTINKWSGPVPISTNKRLLAVGALAMAISSGLIFLLFTYAVPCSSFSTLVYPLDAVGAWGFVVLFIAWQEIFSTLSFQQTCLVYAGGVGVASLSLFIGALVPVRLGIILTVLHPLAVFLLFTTYKKLVPLVPLLSAIRATPTGRHGRIYPAKLIALIVLFYAAGGLMYKLVSLKYAFSDMFWTSNISYMIVVTLAGMFFFFIPNLDLRLMYRPVLPLLAAGFILFPFLKGFWVILSFLLLQAGFALFDMYTFLLFVDVARENPRPAPILGHGMFWIPFSLFIGNLAFSSITPLIPIHRQPNLLVVTAGLITLLTSLVFQDNKETFVGWKTSETKTLAWQEPEPAPSADSEYDRYLRNSSLTPREIEILNMIRKGRNNPFIREKLDISPNTLKFHLRNIYQKFSVGNRQELLSLFDREDR